MKLSTLSVLVWPVSLVSTRFIEKQEADQVVIVNPMEEPEPQYLIEFASGETQWMTDGEKWRLKMVCMHSDRPGPVPNNIKDGQFFMDITNYRDLGNFHSETTRKSQYPRSRLLKEQNKPAPPRSQQNLHPVAFGISDLLSQSLVQLNLRRGLLLLAAQHDPDHYRINRGR